MSADLLREAAQLMRERATAATPGPYAITSSNLDTMIHGSVETGAARYVAGTGDPTFPGAVRDADYIASWHPAVALAVADWLDHLALMALDWEPYKGCGWDGVDHALTVARAYLGRDA